MLRRLYYHCMSAAQKGTMTIGTRVRTLHHGEGIIAAIEDAPTMSGGTVLVAHVRLDTGETRHYIGRELLAVEEKKSKRGE